MFKILILILYKLTGSLFHKKQQFVHIGIPHGQVILLRPVVDVVIEGVRKPLSMGKRYHSPPYQMFLNEKPEKGSFCLLSWDIIIPDHFSANQFFEKRR